MASCEMCGREIYGSPIPIKIEGAVLYVCQNCAKHGERVKEKRKAPNASRTSTLTSKRTSVPKVSSKKIFPSHEDNNVRLVEDYAERIRLARQKMGLTQKEVSIKMKISISELQKLETGKLRPSDDVRKRLEQFFKIKLTEDIKPYTAEEIKKKPTIQTLGDIVVIKEKKKKK